jgi:proteic killer suppression protein
VIITFKNNRTREIFEGKFVKKLPESIASRANIKLIMMDNAADLNDLRLPPSNHLEKLQGDRRGQYSIAINSQWRICFYYYQGNFYQVEIVDYH